MQMTTFKTFLNGPSLASFWFIFGLFFKQTIQFLQQINVIKCPSSIQCLDSNSQPSDYESPRLTTRALCYQSTAEVYFYIKRRDIC